MLRQQRSTDRGLLCAIAKYMSLGWDWIDKRQIDKHSVSIMVMWGTVEITKWSMAFANFSERPGIEVAAIIAAVGVPYMGLQAAAITFYFRARAKDS